MIFLLFVSVLFSKDYEEIEKRLSSKRNYERRKAVYLLKGDTSPVAIQLLKRAVDDRDILTSRLAVSAISLSKSTEVFHFLLTKFSTSTTPDIVRSDIVASSVNFSSDTVKEFIIEALNDKSPLVVKQAIKVATIFRFEEAKDKILDLLSSDEKGVLIEAIKSCAEFPLKEAERKLRKILKSKKDREIRIEALRSLEKIGTDFKFFAKLLEKEKDEMFFLEISLVLVKNGFSVPVDKIIEYSYSSDPLIRYSSVKVFAYLMDNEFVKKRVKELKNDEDERVRGLAGELLEGGE
ncbi:MAG: hypothetical protein DRI36_03970 [Caldiserica bacterium]|nr:MAG: hypothetical protein DRI36_03970 [Caldisericota bacterium]